MRNAGCQQFASSTAGGPRGGAGGRMAARCAACAAALAAALAPAMPAIALSPSLACCTHPRPLSLPRCPPPPPLACLLRRTTRRPRTRPRLSSGPLRRPRRLLPPRPQKTRWAGRGRVAVQSTRGSNTGLCAASDVAHLCTVRPRGAAAACWAVCSLLSRYSDHCVIAPRDESTPVCCLLFAAAQAPGGCHLRPALPEAHRGAAGGWWAASQGAHPAADECLLQRRGAACLL